MDMSELYHELEPGKLKDKLTQFARVCTRPFHFKWKIDGFNNIPFVTGHPIYSSPFVLGSPTDSVFQVLMTKEIKILPLDKDKGSDKEPDSKSETEPTAEPSKVIRECEKDAIIPTPSQGMSTRSKNKKKVILDVKNEDEDGKKLKTVGFLMIRTTEGSGWEVVDYDVSVRFGQTSANAEIIPNDNSAVQFSKSYKYICDDKAADLFQTETIDVTVSITHKILEEDPLYNPKYADEMDRIATDCEKFRQTNMYADILLTCGKEEIPAHLNILCVRTYYFDSEYQDGKVKEENELKVDVGKTVMDALLKFMYRGGIPFTLPIEEVPRLYSAAKKFGVDFLPDLCSEYFKFLLDSEVCLKCLGIVTEADNFAERASEVDEEHLKEILSKQPCNHEK